MKRKKQGKIVVDCQCNICEQRANAQAGTEHMFCRGLKLTGKARFLDLCGAKKGLWVSMEDVRAHQEQEASNALRASLAAREAMNALCFLMTGKGEVVAQASMAAA